MTGPTVNVTGGAFRQVVGPTGSRFPVLTDEEAAWWNMSRDLYMAENKFEANTDLQDLEKLMQLELIVFRMGQYIQSEADYDGNPLKNTIDLTKQMKDVTDAVVKLKAALGISRSARDKAASAGSFAVWWPEALRRAKAWSVKRSDECDKLITLGKELQSLVEKFDRSSEVERHKVGLPNEAAIVTWLRDVFIPEIDAIDQEFIDQEQKYWGKSL